MPGPSKKWYFETTPFNDHDDGESRRDGGEDDPAAGVISVPEAVLQRHGARVLDPSSAAAVYEPPGPAGHRARPPRSTVYRARTLLIPNDLVQDAEVLQEINDVLGGIGMTIVVPGDQRRFRSGRRAEILRQLPRPAVLAPAPPRPGRPVQPVVVDAWTALQALRSAASVADDSAVLNKRVVRRLALEHLLVAAGITGSPSTGGHPLTGPGSADSYVYSGGDTRAPVAVCMDPPARRSLGDCGSRRPVVAVLDTGVRAHQWLDVGPDPATEYRVVSDGFVGVDPLIQEIIYLEGQSAASQGDQPRQLIEGPWDKPVTDDPLIGELEDASGHGSFIAGIVRQVAPDAQVLAIRVMHSDDVVAEGDLICALSLLADRVAYALEGHMDQMVDVVSLSLGYFDESAADVQYSSGLWQVIEQLLGMGVAVVASAGNSATSRRCYPAAFAVLPPPGSVPLISVGALNPNGSKALFSNDGRWVRAWAAGAAVVSTFPVDINASRTPEVRVPGRSRNGSPPVDREALDPDDYRGGFATWSGTSFSAPLLAAHIAARLLEDSGSSALSLDQPGQDAASKRMVAALTAMGWQG
jgi:subtilisin family serine protease